LLASSRPFEILNQFPAHDAPVTAILSLESYLFTAAEHSGSIQQWLVTDEETDQDNNSSTSSSTNSKTSTKTQIVPLQLLADAHSDTIVCLKAVRMTASQDDDYDEDDYDDYDDDDDDETSVLFSASQDGTLALWDIKGGDLLYTHQMTDTDNMDQAVRIQCADVTSDGTHVFVGTVSGQVWAYNVVDWMALAAQGQSQGQSQGDGAKAKCPLPAGRWTASTTGPITSLSCAGPGSLGRGGSSGGSGSGSSLLLTGAADGVVKQWEVLSRPGIASTSSTSDSSSGMSEQSMLTPSTRLEQWPKLPTQRLPKKAHLFRGHDMDVTALLPVDATKFLSASKDGTVRAWNPATGKELFSMDGFTEALASLVLAQDDLLVTDGMKQFVCVHDFDIEAYEEGSSGYDLLED
jgi:WD40 repeat protein